VIDPSAAERRVSGIRSSVPRILPAWPFIPTTSSLTLTIRLLLGQVLDAGARLADPVRARDEIVIGTEENAPVGMCFMPVTDPKTVKNRVHLDLTSSAADRDQEIGRLQASGPAGSISGRPAQSPGLSLPTQSETSSASCARRKHSSDEAQHREPQTDPVRGM
jgi:hypothetical protein